jgi:hypothetical protein
MVSMPRPIRQIAACSDEGPGACEGVGAGDNGYRMGDANMRSAWICTCNDPIGNF